MLRGNISYAFWAAAPEGQMTYDSTQDDFLRFPSPPLDLKSYLSDLKSDLSDLKSGLSDL